MVRLSLKRPPLWSLVLILLAVTGSIAYVLVTGMAHTNNHPAAPDFTMSSSSSSQGIFQGQSGTAQITITSVAGFTGTVNLSMTISPGGANSISASMSQNTLALAADKGNNTTINMSTTSAATISYSVVVIGKSGSLSHQLTVSVTVLSTSRCTPDYICPGVADPLSIAVSQNASTWQVSQMTIYNYGAFYLSVYAYYYTYADESQMSSEYIVNGQMAPNGFLYFQPAQPGVQVYGVTVLWQTPLPPPMYTQNSQLNQSWVSMPLVARENLLLEADVFNSGTNVTHTFGTRELQRSPSLPTMY